MVVVLFDWDGTLVRREVAEEASMRRAKSLGLKVSREKLREAMKGHDHYVWNKEAIEKYIGVNDERLKTKIMTNFFQWHYLGVVKEWKGKIFHEGVWGVLKGLKEKGVKMGVISMLREDIVGPALEIVGLDLFEGIYGNAADLIYGKKDLVGRALKDFKKVDLMVGDREDDVEAGREVGAKTVWVSWGHGESEGADYKIDKAEELLGIVGGF